MRMMTECGRGMKGIGGISEDMEKMKMRFSGK